MVLPNPIGRSQFPACSVAECEMNVLRYFLISTVLVLCSASLGTTLAQGPSRSPREIIKASERIIEGDRKRGVDTKASIYYFLSSAHLQIGTPDEALKAILTGREVAAKNGEDLVTANLILLQSVALNQLDRSEEGVAVLREGLKLSRELGNRRLEVKMQTELGSNLVQLTQSSDAVAAYGRAIRLANDIGDQELATPAKLNLVTLLSDFATEDMAVDKLKEMLQQANRTKNPLWRCSIELNLASSLADVGRFDEAKKHIRSVQEQLQVSDNHFLSATAWFNLAVIYEHEGNADAAARCLEAAHFQAQLGGRKELSDAIQQKIALKNLNSITTLDAFVGNLEDQLDEKPPGQRRREILQALAECEALRGNWRRVASYQTELYRLSKTQNVETIQAEVNDLLEQLEVQQRELRIEVEKSARLIAENRVEKQLRRSQLDATRLSYCLSAASLCCVALVIWVLVRRAFVRRWILSQKQIEGVLRTANDTWKNTFDALDDAVCTLTENGKVELYNNAFCELFFASLQRDSSVSVDDIITHYFDHADAPFKGIRKLRYESDGFEKWFRIDKLALPSGSEPMGEVDSILVIRDVSADIRIRETMLASQRAAEDATKVKSEFVAIVSHELRTPLAAICGAIDLIREECELTAASDPLFDAISNASLRLSRLIDDLLDYSSIERGKIILTNAPFNVVQTVKDCVRPIAHLRPDLDVTLNVDKPVPKFLLGDVVRYSQVLSNLLANAERATDVGRININITANFPTNQGVELVTEIEDTGIGIPLEKQERVFEPFEQASCSDRRRNGGAGLGLAICKSLTQAMGGEITMTSTPDSGSTFSFSTRFGTVDESKVVEDGAPAEQSELRVLVVDDDKFCRMITARLVESLGHQVMTAASGVEAIQMGAVELATFDLIIMDLMMPGMTGFEAAAKIRTWAAADDLPIFALTAKTGAADRQTSRSAGINAYLVKPLTRDQLAAKLALVNPKVRTADQS